MPRITKLASLATLGALLVSSALKADVRLPALFSDHMVLQRDRPIVVWGWADPGESVSVKLQEQRSTIQANLEGKWKATLEGIASGEDLTLTVAGESNTIELSNIAMGDVWICSGQSNMEWPLSKTDRASQDIPKADHANLRLFTVEKEMSFQPLDDVSSSGWRVCRPESAAEFSAVAYYFGKEIHQQTEVPIGLIHSSWGGTDIQTWTSWEVMSQTGEYEDLDPAEMAKSFEEAQANRQRFREAMSKAPGEKRKWMSPKTDVSDWKPVTLPQPWELGEIGAADGIVWYRKSFDIPQALAGSPATLSLTPIDDQDVTYLNGERIGSTSAWDAPRRYNIPRGKLKAGANTLVVKVVDHQGGGGFHGDPNLLFIEADGVKIPLTENWVYRPSVLSSDFGKTIAGPNAYPSLLYNAMIHPLLDFQIAGAIWYQGENNVNHAYRYRSYFTSLIKDWRHGWGWDFPFYWAQLANYMAPQKKPINSAWAELREAQDFALGLPRTGQAVLIDLGEADDIHPRNKRDVGYRLALNALYDTYGMDLVHTGPRFRAMTPKGREMVLSFDHTQGGLHAVNDRYGYLKGFTVAGDDQVFHWAKARIVGDKVIVSSPNVRKVVAVRYAWASNPDDANLYNGEGLPAAPFRTDDWQGVTFGK
ncbi:sialate O-acetylesterase [Pelagicoccus sp. SDUM812003]|uniref:sialate O-acetylesterase n=1 Tax=Pelagicoccus sp. SDUM812003 TaxID=3041267 RepID=UPI00280FEAD9|nr:sialate O-acetylesterase [Pelagicoccus sp. SDUM812003]MDQ8205263.1 sialate O-acetylesterase [Pelagicoccus sp. SDUM812003]